MQEQRRYIRYNLEGSVNLKPEDSMSSIIKADLVDIGYLGFGVYVNEKIEAGIEINFELIPKLWYEPIIGRGKVKYVQEIKKYDHSIFRLGVEFIDINNDTIQCLINRILQDICIAARRRRAA